MLINTHTSPTFQCPTLIRFFVFLVIMCISLDKSNSVELSDWQDVSNSDIQKFENMVRTVLKCRQVPAASITLVKNNVVLLSKNYGYSDPERQISVKRDTKFCIGSLTKAFTAVILSKILSEHPNVTWETSVKSILGDEFRLSDDLRTDMVNIEDLLAHRVGTPAYFNALLVGFPEEVTRLNLIKRLRYMPAVAPFRSKFMYSNYMYTLAGHVAEILSGKSWETLVNEYMLTPLRMSSSGFITDRSDFKDIALPCALKHGKLVNLNPILLHSVYPCGPAGSLYTTSDDMAKWLLMLLNSGKDMFGNQVFENNILEETFKPMMPVPFPGQDLLKTKYPISDVQVSYDLGWVTSYYRGYKKIWHSGGITTHSSRLWFYPDNNVGIFAAVNGPQTREKTHAMRTIMSYASDILLGETPWLNYSTICTFPAPWAERHAIKEPVTVKRVAGDLRTRAPRELVGHYYHLGFGEIRVHFGDGGALILRYGRFGKMFLHQEKGLEFSGKYFGPLWFITDSDDSVQSEKIRFVRRGMRISGLYFYVDPQYDPSFFRKGKMPKVWSDPFLRTENQNCNQTSSAETINAVLTCAFGFIGFTLSVTL
ncbi:hypothetical protein LOTGIDRAFT_165563 [Lottia gigantea]|uniref:Beta-lactamase-related domain-containing protein n=1 Tax=Lottia gigantea TaxID=225164 RepID=V3ZBN9_LOTGI|nr:hypothetical protein LOTGIDRAFT_165563 [Lottia gigantea]ESO88438.1 hypothetical protein LOTGIDRAFT_165563 [Lottia gigantea]